MPVSCYRLEEITWANSPSMELYEVYSISPRNFMSINISILVLNMWNQLYFNSCACFLMSKWHQLPVISNGRQALLPTASWYLSHQGKCQHWKEHCFTLMEKRGVRSASIVGFRPLWPAGPRAANTEQRSMHTPLVLQQKDPDLSLWNLKYWKLDACLWAVNIYT